MTAAVSHALFSAGSIRRAALLVALVTSYTVTVSAFAGEWGEFTRNARVELLERREIRLLEDFAYVAPDGTVWVAPVGSVVDGASVPRIAWQFVPPLTGAYRDASIIHDVACDRRKASWELTHRAFYTAMRARGVDAIKAKVMYAAVYHFGPRWERKQKFRNIRPKDVDALTDAFESSAPGSLIDQNVEASGASRSDDPRVDLTLQARPLASAVSDTEFGRLVDALNSGESTISLEEIDHWNRK